ncbi:MAG TPA: cytochrome c-type biogenesis protein CcmH [Solirubrobacteraceae bacterium]|nr:cytochrome c-type biogenesis protein CcmH [Solirubrobacteraceae bacterium]
MTTRATAPIALVTLALVGSLVGAGGAAAAHPARASLLDIENDVMCVVCNEPLAVSNSPEAYQERGFIRGLIAEGETKSQIERALVVQYGPAVLGRPPAHGFNLTVYVLPPAIVLAGLAILALTLPRWRRRALAARAHPVATGPPLDPAETTRLEEELSRYGG